jgi:hypothetical protein
LGLLGLKLTSIKTSGKGKKNKIYQIDPETWNDGRNKIFAVWKRNAVIDLNILQGTPAAPILSDINKVPAGVS